MTAPGIGPDSDRRTRYSLDYGRPRMRWDTIARTAATQLSIEDLLLGARACGSFRLSAKTAEDWKNIGRSSPRSSRNSGPAVYRNRELRIVL